MRRGAVGVALAAAMLAIGCGQGEPGPGEVYMLTKPARCWAEGIGAGDYGALDTGSVVRVIEAGETEDGKSFLMVTVEKAVGAVMVERSEEGESGEVDTEPSFDRPVFLNAKGFHAAPTAAP